MFVTYNPEDPTDGDAGEWVFNPGRVRASEGQALLREFGEKSWDLFVQGIRTNDLHARRVLLWHLSKRAHPLMRFADTPDFFADEMTVEFSTVELAELIDKISSSPASAGEKAQAVDVLTAELEVARSREELADNPGKALTPTSSTESTTTG